MIAYLGYKSFVTNLTNFLDVLLVIFIPWSAVNLADYFLIRRGRYDVASFFAADGAYGRFAWRGLLAYAAGLAAQWPFVSQPDYTGPLVKTLGGADISWLVGWFTAAITYLLLVASCRTRTPASPLTWRCTHAAISCRPPGCRSSTTATPPAAATRGAAAHWTKEGIEDVEMMHALAPDAALVYLQIPDADPGLMYDQALSWLVSHVRPDVVSYSSGTPEFTGPARHSPGCRPPPAPGSPWWPPPGTPGPPSRPAPACGRRSIALWPASDPLVTALGGTWLHVDRAGNRVRPDTAFSDAGGSWAGGAGLSAIFSRPAWQDSVRRIVGDHRGIADVSMDASECSPVAVYQQALAPAGWGTSQGTSMSTALFAALAADAAQAAGHRLGVLGPALYSLRGLADGLLDVTEGSDSIPGMPGWPARPGYDLPTGIGTVAAALPFVTALARAAPG